MIYGIEGECVGCKATTNPRFICEKCAASVMPLDAHTAIDLLVTLRRCMSAHDAYEVLTKRGFVLGKSR